MDTSWSCTWSTGPDTGGRHPLPVGRHVVGRAGTADVRCDDPALRAHHALVEIAADGAARWTPLHGAVRGVGPQPITNGTQVALGDSVLEFRVEAEPVTPRTPAAIVGGAVLRHPRAVPRHEPAEVPDSPTPPAPADRPGGLMPAMLGLGGAALIALVLRRPMFLLFGAMGAVVALGSWGAQWMAARRTRTRRRAEFTSATLERAAVLDADREAFLQWHLARVPTTTSARAAIEGPTIDLWSRRADHDDAFIASIGRAAAPWRDGALPDLPTAAEFGPGHRIAITGPSGMSVARGVLSQLTAVCGPADLRLVIVTDRPGAWDCVRALPHLALPDGTAAVVDEAGLAAAVELLATNERAHLLVVTDVGAALATRTSPLRRLVGSDDVALLAVLGDEQGVPHLCTSVLGTTDGPFGRWIADTARSVQPVPVRLAGRSDRSTFAHTAALACLHDPEDPLLAAGQLPRDLSLARLLTTAGMDLSADAIAARWSAGDAAPRTPIGTAMDGIVDVDLVRDGPHGLLAGTTGAGKSELLRTLIAGLAVNVSPAQLAIVLVDYKGGAAFDAVRRLPHVVGLVTDLDDDLADRALRSLQAELRRREAVLREHGAADLATLRATSRQIAMPRLLVVIDEFAALVAEQPDFLHALVGVAQRGRSLGVHLLLATQRPHGVISDDIRANTNLRLALRVQDSADAVDVVGDRSPAQFPRGVPGRALMRLGADEYVTFQAAHATRDDLHELVEAVRVAAELTRTEPPAAPWLPPLPTVVGRTDLPPGAVGLCDEPDRQAQVPLRWSPSAGSVVVAGSAGAGVSSALHTLAGQALVEPNTHVYVLTTAHDDGPCVLHPRCLTVAAHERERLGRLLHRLRATHTGDGVSTVLVIDGLDSIRRTLDHAESADEYDSLDHVLADPDITVIIGTSRPAAVPSAVLARCAQRWVLHLHDPHDAAVLGVPARAVPGQGSTIVPGRAYVIPLGVQTQLVRPGAVPLHPIREGGAGPVPSIDVVPPIVHADAMPRGRQLDDTDLLPIGLAVATGSPWELEVPDGEHVLVLGGTRAGRSSALTRLTVAWRDLHPGGRVIIQLPRRSAFDRSVADEVLANQARPRIEPGRPTLLLADDAELIDDADGAWAALAAGRAPGLTIIAAARPDALRHLYGHWTSVVRRSRLGLVAAGGADTDGDLVGAVLPRRLPLAARPGLYWAAVQGSVQLVQVAIDRPHTTDNDIRRLTDEFSDVTDLATLLGSN